MYYLRKLVTTMMPGSDVAKRILEDAVQEFAQATRFPLAFGGFEQAGIAHVSALAGNRTLSLHSLKVNSGRGLGGRAMSERRPRLTFDYARCEHITHDYDREVSGEGIVALFAMPVIVSGDVRAVLYGGTRSDSFPGTSFMHAGEAVTKSLANEILIEDEVNRRLEVRAEARAQSRGSALEALRSEYAELRRITAAVKDPTLRADLLALERRIAKAGAMRTQVTPEPENIDPQPHLTQRELDVLSQVALGQTNAEVGRCLSLTESTVKSYLNSVMGKLGASSRFAAVTYARRIGFIP